MTTRSWFFAILCSGYYEMFQTQQPFKLRNPVGADGPKGLNEFGPLGMFQLERWAPIVLRDCALSPSVYYPGEWIEPYSCSISYNVVFLWPSSFLRTPYWNVVNIRPLSKTYWKLSIFSHAKTLCEISLQIGWILIRFLRRRWNPSAQFFSMLHFISSYTSDEDKKTKFCSILFFHFFSVMLSVEQ